MKYRPEIDGLRAIAVIAVIIYHAEFTWRNGFLLEGGFFGVDIFFVISGFLITTLIIHEYQSTGRFSLKHFYERRARRILPALLTVMALSLPFAWNYLLPDQLIDFSKSQIASLLFGSNLYWLNSLQQYGAESGLLKPFLHTWSLAAEEQFYLVFPLFFVGIYRWHKSRYTMSLLTSVFFLSFLFAVWMTPRDASFSFYMLPSRFWELLVGGLVANILNSHPQKDNDTLLNKVLPVVGLFLIIYAVFISGLTFSNLNHPGFVTLAPVLGTALIISFTNGEDLISRILSNKLFVGIGLISYSLYLYHYPIFAFGRVIDFSASTYVKIMWILLSFLGSTVTYFVIEQPFRNRKVVSVKALAISVPLLMMVVGGISFYWLLNDGFESRLGYLQSTIASSKRVMVVLDGNDCHSGGGSRPEFDVSESCVFNYYPGQRYLISIGDSHAASISESLRILAQENGLNFVEITEAGCAHIIGVGKPHCQERAGQTLLYLKNFPNAIIIYSARIPLYMEQNFFDNQEGDKENGYHLVNKNEVISDYPKRAELLISTLNGWKNAGYTLVIVYPVPEQGYQVSNKLFTARPVIRTEKQLPDLSTSLSVFRERTKSSYDALDRVTGDNVFRVYPESIFCDKETGRCYASKGSKIFFAGDNHVSPLGSNLITEQIAKELGLVIPNQGYQEEQPPVK